jgi:hypothetical protein
MTEELARLARRRAQMAENRKRCREYWATDWFGVAWDDGAQDQSHWRKADQIRHNPGRGNSAETVRLGPDTQAEIKETKGR